MKRIVIFCLFFSFYQKSPAQETEIFPYASLDSRNSVVKEVPVTFFGARAGLTINKYGAGVGYYKLVTSIYETASKKLNFSYGTIWGSRELFTSRKFDLEFIVQAGYGGAYAADSFLTPVYLVEPSLSGTYKIIPWLGLAGGFGIRKTIYPDLLKTNNYNGGIASIGFTILPGALWEMIRKKKKPSEKDL